MLKPRKRDMSTRLKSEGLRRGVATPFFMQYQRHRAVISCVANHTTVRLNWIVISIKPGISAVQIWR
jgi:hypothetical protein